MEQLMVALPYVLMVVVIYIFMIRLPQNKVKKEKEFQNSIKVGEKIITTSGIHGKVVELGDKTVVIETMSGKLKIERAAISQELSAALNTK